MMNAQNVLKVHGEVFYGALLSGDLDTLATLYSDDYRLVRSDGSILNKIEVLRDLRDSGLAFTSIMLCIEEVRLFRTAAMVIGKCRATATRGGLSKSTQFRLVAVYEQIDAALRLAYFQSTDLADHTFAQDK
jgi:ketosteroid isomerase-like protein